MPKGWFGKYRRHLENLDMTDLIFHIGFPKCASGTIQNKVLAGTPGYLGTGKSISVQENFAKQFQAFAPIGPRLRGNWSAAHDWKRRVLKHARENFPNAHRYIASTEFLTNRNKFHPRPIVPFLNRFSKEIWSIGRIKTILVLRNPAERIASGYAQSSGSTFGACQQHFENHVQRILERDLEVLDLAAWVDDLFQALGRENVCVLLMEDIQRMKFWQELGDFAELDDFNPESMLSTHGLNQRKLNTSTWKLAEFNPWNKAKSQSGKLVGLLWPGGRLPSLRGKSISALAHSLTVVHTVNPARFRERQRGTQIELTDELRERIRRRCQPYHQRLAELLGRDLEELGY